LATNDKETYFHPFPWRHSSRYKTTLIRNFNIRFLTHFPMNEASMNHSLAQTVDPDRAIRKGRATEYPKQMGYFIACCVAVVSLYHLVTLVASYTFARRVPKNNPPRTGPRFSRLPRAIINSFRAVAFRRTVSIGSVYTFTLAELFLAAGYIVAVFTWSFINCQSSPLVP
jgi:hypothetical protein